MLTILKRNNLNIIVISKVQYSSKNINSNLRLLLEKMPKEHKHIAEAQKQRKKIKEKFSKYVPGRISLQVLGTGAEGAPRSLYVFSDQSRYLFNCSEGTQRLAHEHKMKLAKLEHIFITQSSWKNIGGLPGTALTIQDVGVPQITLHGPKGLKEIFTATSRFIVLRDLKIKMAECAIDNVYEDNVMTVYYVPIRKKGLGSETRSFESNKGQTVYDELSSRNPSRTDKKISKSRNPECSKITMDEDDIDYYAHERIKRSVADKLYDEIKLEMLKDIKDKCNVMCYICKLQPRPGALNLEKCVKYGMPSGPLLGKLKMGEDVILPTGVLVKSADVCEPDDPGPVFIVVDCPSEDYLESFVTNSAFLRYQATAQNNENLAYLVVHFTPQHILSTPRYREWVNKFSPSTHHLVLNDGNSCMGSMSVHRIQYKLNLLHKSIFPLLGDNGSKYDSSNDKASSVCKKLKSEDPSKEDSDNNSSIVSEASSTFATQLAGFIYANTFCNFHLRPKRGLDRSSELILTPSKYVEEAMTAENFDAALTNLKDMILKTSHSLKIRPYPRLLFLGTGSCIPNKTRNTSGILLESCKDINILLDCGEGTYGQLVRFFGPKKIDEILVNIKAIFISHLHADHHIGLIGLLQGRRKAFEKLNKKHFHPVLLLAPKQILTWLNFYDKYFEDIAQEFELIPNGELLQDEQTLFEGTKVRISQHLGMSDINTTLVNHCPNAFGVAFSQKQGYKLCYSGDTMPSENLINLGMNCDILIHEATMEDELEHEAITKMHSTTSQAIEVGRNMNAKYILLTHFSQRYAKLPRFNENFGENVGIAFDNMHAKMDELPLVSLFYPALRAMFAEHYEELENKAIKRQMRLERGLSLTSCSSKQLHTVKEEKSDSSVDTQSNLEKYIALSTTTQSHQSSDTSYSSNRSNGTQGCSKVFKYPKMEQSNIPSSFGRTNIQSSLKRPISPQGKNFTNNNKLSKEQYIKQK